MAEFEADPRWEFDAPKFYDFSQLDGDPAPADEWFATAPDGPGTRPKGMAQVTAPEGAREALAEIQQPSSKAAAPHAEPGGKGTVKKANILTSWGGAAGTKRTAANARLDGAGGSHAASGAAAGAANPKTPGDQRKVPRTERAAGAASSMRAAAGAASGAADACAPAATPAITLQVLRPRFVDEQGRTRAAVPQAQQAWSSAAPTAASLARSMSVPPAQRRAGLGVAATTAMKARSKSVAKPRGAKTPAPAKSRSSPSAALRRGAQTDVRRVLQPRLMHQARSTKPLTLPEDVELHTSRRLRGQAEAAEEQQAGHEGPSPYKPLALKVLEFQTKTPQRFRRATRGAGAGGATEGAGGSRTAAKPAGGSRGVTQAKTPVLWTTTRTRPRRFKSRAEQEEEEAEASMGLGAKSHEPRTAAKSAGLAGITEVRPFHFRSDDRAAARSHDKEAAPRSQAREGAGGRLKLGSLNRSILDGPTFQVRHEPFRPTVPKSPLLRTKHLPQHEAPREQPRYNFRARPVPQYDSVGSIPYVPSKDVTHPAPFHLATERRGRQHEAREHEVMEAQARHEAEARRVKARPLPLSTDVGVVPPRPAARDLTLPNPFRLRSEARHEDYVTQRRQQLEEEEERRREETAFKAGPMPDAGRPFVVHESDRSLTVPEDPHLRTEGRAPQRQAFDAHMSAKMAAQEEERRQAEEEARRQEEREAAEYRKGLVFKARPMPTFDEPELVLPSAKPLTQAKTPNFASKRLRRRSPK